MNDLKVKAIKEYPVLRDKKQVKSFLGLASFYRMFVKDFAKIAAPLSNLMKEEAEFIWDEPQQQAFQTPKNCLTNPPVLAFLDFDKFFIACNAINIGI